MQPIPSPLALREVAPAQLSRLLRDSRPMLEVNPLPARLPDLKDGEQVNARVVDSLSGNRFLVLPPWLADSNEFPGRDKIVIEPKSAFGTGHHATTALCLTVLSELVESGRVKAGQHFLDLGTGSGVLGIGCCKSGLTGEGYDIDMLAVENAIENRGINGIEGFEVGLGSIDALEGRTYDLVLANILARPLIELSQRIVWACKPGACLVLSGLLEIQADSVEEAYMAQCLPKPRRVIDGEIGRASCRERVSSPV